MSIIGFLKFSKFEVQTLSVRGLGEEKNISFSIYVKSYICDENLKVWMSTLKFRSDFGLKSEKSWKCQKKVEWQKFFVFLEFYTPENELWDKSLFVR
jgi:hypothetical protein